MIKNSRIEVGKTPVPGSEEKCNKVVNGNPVSSSSPLPNKSFDKIASILDNSCLDENKNNKRSDSREKEKLG